MAFSGKTIAVLSPKASQLGYAIHRPATRARLSCRPGAPSSRVAGSAQLAVIDRPARLTQKPNDLTMAVATGPQRTVGNIGSQLFFLVTAPRDLVLRRAVLPGAAGPGAGVSAGHSNMLE
jgi:hypothetical protein